MVLTFLLLLPLLSAVSSETSTGAKTVDGGEASGGRGDDGVMAVASRRLLRHEGSSGSGWSLEADSQSDDGNGDDVRPAGGSLTLLEADTQQDGGDDGLLEIKSKSTEDVFRRRGGPRRRRGVTSVILDYPFDSNIGNAQSGIWEAAFVRNGARKAVHLNNPSGALIDRKKAGLRFTSNNSFLEFPQVAPNAHGNVLKSYSLMFDFMYKRQTGKRGHTLLQYATPEHDGIPFAASNIGFRISKSHSLLFRGASRTIELKQNVRDKWIHVGLTASHPCTGTGSLKIFIDGKLEFDESKRKDEFNICGQKPFVNLECWDRGKKCSARLELLLDNMLTVEDYAAPVTAPLIG